MLDLNHLRLCDILYTCVFDIILVSCEVQHTWYYLGFIYLRISYNRDKGSGYFELAKKSQQI